MTVQVSSTAWRVGARMRATQHCRDNKTHIASCHVSRTQLCCVQGRCGATLAPLTVRIRHLRNGQLQGFWAPNVQQIVTYAYCETSWVQCSALWRPWLAYMSGQAAQSHIALTADTQGWAASNRHGKATTPPSWPSGKPLPQSPSSQVASPSSVIMQLPSPCGDLAAS